MSERRTERRRVGSSLSPLFRRVPAPVVASPLESHASYSPGPFGVPFGAGMSGVMRVKPDPTGVTERILVTSDESS